MDWRRWGKGDKVQALYDNGQILGIISPVEDGWSWQKFTPPLLETKNAAKLALEAAIGPPPAPPAPVGK